MNNLFAMNRYKTELKWAIYFMIMSLLWMMMERVLGWHDEWIAQHPLYTNLIAIPAIALYVFALLDKRKTDFLGEMTYQQGFVSGLVISIIVMIFSPVTQLLTSYIITPHYFQHAITNAVSSGQMSQEAAESYFSIKSYIIQGIVGAPVMGIVTSAVVAFFVKNKKQSSA
jgi:hypothetical protein